MFEATWIRGWSIFLLNLQTETILKWCKLGCFNMCWEWKTYALMHVIFCIVSDSSEGSNESAHLRWLARAFACKIVKTDDYENIYNFMLKNVVYLNLCTCTCSWCADSPEPLLLANTKYGYELKLKPKFRFLVTLDKSAWTYIKGICAHTTSTVKPV